MKNFPPAAEAGETERALDVTEGLET